MNTLTKLLIIVGSTAATVAVALAALNALHNLHPELYALAKSIAAGKNFHVNNPVMIEVYKVAYSYNNNGVVLTKTQADATPALYAVAFGNSCPPIDDLLGYLYTSRNNTVILGQCVYVLPIIEGNRVVNYVPTCKSGTEFKPEVITTRFIYRAVAYEVTLYIIKC
jgi:hypothetical protein